MPVVETKPVLGKVKSTTPWKPANLMEAEKREGFRRRWTNVDYIEKRLREGWETVQAKSASPTLTLLDGTQLTNVVRKRNLILMEVPEELACEMEEHYRNLGDVNLNAGLQEFKNNVPGGFGGIKNETGG